MGENVERVVIRALRYTRRWTTFEREKAAHHRKKGTKRVEGLLEAGASGVL